MPDEFVISDKIRELAKIEGLPEPETQVKKFLDYHETTGWKMKNGLKIVNKEAAFRNWLRNAKTYSDEKAGKVHTKDPKPVRSVADRQRDLFSQPDEPTDGLLSDEQVERGRAIIQAQIDKLTKKFSVGGK